MIQTDYRIGALPILLDSACLSEKYAPLVPHRDALAAGLRRMDCRTKNDALRLSDTELASLGLASNLMELFRRFLVLYDPKPQKFREIDCMTAEPAVRAAFRELYLLPGVKAVRASLYMRAGYSTLRAIADALPEEILARTAETIRRDGLPCIVPLPKEVRTHIAVAKAFLWRDD